MLHDVLLSNVRFVVRFPNKKTVSVAIVRKCGTSTVYSVLGYPRLKKITRSNKDALSAHNEFWMTNDQCPFPINYKFAIVRDPVERLYSIYKQRIVIRNVDNIQDKVKSWDEFVCNFKDIRKEYDDIAKHSYGQSDKLGIKPNDYDYVYNTNQLSSLFIPKISDISEVDIPNAQLKKSREVHEDITDKHKNLIQKYFEKDYLYWEDYFQ